MLKHGGEPTQPNSEDPITLTLGLPDLWRQYCIQNLGFTAWGNKTWGTKVYNLKTSRIEFPGREIVSLIDGRLARWSKAFHVFPQKNPQEFGYFISLEVFSQR